MNTYNKVLNKSNYTQVPRDETWETIEKMNKTAIEVEKLTVAYQGKVALQDISLEISSGQITGIIGPNGAGKSSLIKGSLGLVETVEKKPVQVFGEPLDNKRSKVAYVEQRNSLDLSFPISVIQTVLLGTYPNLGYFHRPGAKEKKLAIQALETVGMSAYADRQIGELSGGQLQRVFIARALAQEAEILLLDEPFIGIDAVSEKLIVSLLKQLKAEGKTVVIVHHDLHKVREYFDHVIILDRVLIANGPTETVFTTENIQKAYGDSMGDVLLKGA